MNLCGCAETVIECYELAVFPEVAVRIEGRFRMLSQKQQKAARKNIRKAQTTWKTMTPRQRARIQPEGSAREKPGAGGGEYYLVVVRPKEEFKTFRYHDVGKPRHIQRLAGKRESGSWDAQAWVIGKEDAHVENGKLVANTEDARKVLEQLGSEPTHVSGDRFEAKPRPNVPERQKPTPAMKRAQRENIKKAQAARHKR